MAAIPSVEQTEAAALARALHGTANRLRELADDIDRAAAAAEAGTTSDYTAVAGTVLHDINCTLMNLMVGQIVRTAAAADVARATGQ